MEMPGGRLHREGWGTDHGFPGLEWDPDGDPVPVEVFVSRELPDHWGRVDAFEGQDYRRTVVPVEGLPDALLLLSRLRDRGPYRRRRAFYVSDLLRAMPGIPDVS